MDFNFAITDRAAADTAAELARRQPLGIFAMPASLFVLPRLQDATRESGLLDQLMRGRIPGDMPSAWRFFGLAVERNVEAAGELLAQDDSVVAAYNRRLLRPDSGLRECPHDKMPFPLSALSRLVAFTLGNSDEVPPLDGLYDEYRGMALSICAAAAIDRGEPQRAIPPLQEAVEVTRDCSPLLAAQLLGQLADLICEDESQWAAAAQHYRDAISLAENSAIVTIPAELWFGLGALYQLRAQGRRGPLLESVRCYQNGLQCGITIKDHGPLYAHAQSQIGLAYLAIPLTESSDQLRVAIALQSLREALKVYDKQTYPHRWATVQLNVANAYQYLPSAHPQENLIEAVKIYDDILTVRNKAMDPIGYARVLSNQSNALAHLGIFAPALEKLSEARKLFSWHDETELANSAMELAHQIHVRMHENRHQGSTTTH